ncbi:MAG: hypothetical protein IJ151_00315 [Bacteroidales bacterium]|nr:hypothetical protein [Bacteroidales bacterium]
MPDFLSSFKRKSLSSGTDLAKEEILRLDETTDGKTVLKILNEKGDEIRPDYRRFQGPLFSLLRYIEASQSELGRRISWDGHSGQLILDQHPQLMRYLCECSGVLDKDGEEDILR